MRFSSPARDTARRACWRPFTSKALTPRSTRTRAKTSRGCASSSRNSRSPAASAATARRRRPGRSTRVGNWATRISHAFGAAFDNPDLLVVRRRGRRRSRDRAAGHFLAFQQVPQPHPRRRGAAGPSPQRLQDQQPHTALAHLPRGAGRPVQGLRMDAALRRRRRPAADAPEDGRRHAGMRVWTSAVSSRTRAQGQGPHAAALAHDHPAQPQGLDGPGGSGRQESRGILAVAPGAAVRSARQSRAPEATRSLAAELQAGRAVRQGRTTRARVEGARPQGRPAHERQPARQRRACPQGAADARLPQLRDQGREARHRHRREHASAGPVPARRHEAEHDELPRVRPRREHARTSSTRSTRSARSSGSPTTSPKTPTADSSHPTAACSRCSPSTRSKAGSRATSSPAGTASSRRTRPSSTSSTRCSTSTPSGWPSATSCRGARRSRRSTC